MEKSGKNIYDQQYEALFTKPSMEKYSKLVKLINKCTIVGYTPDYLQKKYSIFQQVLICINKTLSAHYNI